MPTPVCAILFKTTLRNIVNRHAISDNSESVHLVANYLPLKKLTRVFDMNFVYYITTHNK